MKRRSFLKFCAATPLVLAACKYDKNSLKEMHIFTPGTDKSFPVLEVHGSYRDIGYYTGKYFGDNIKDVMKQRKEWMDELNTIRNSKDGKAYFDALQKELEKTYPQFLEELKGVAEGSGIDYDTILTISFKSELDAFRKEPPGCSTVFYKKDDKAWLFHNEDGHAAFKENMFILKAHPPSGVSFICLVYAGLIPGVGPGINSNGVITSANFIGCTKPEIGIPRYFLARRILEAKSLEEAKEIATQDNRAFPWHHNLGDAKSGEYYSIETLPDGMVESNKPDGLYIHTNHTIMEKTKDYIYQDQDYKNTSSVSRYEVLQSVASQYSGAIEKPEDIMNWLSSHDRAPYSPCRHPKDDVKGLTLGTAFFDLKNNMMRIYKGNPCEAVKHSRYAIYKFD